LFPANEALGGEEARWLACVKGRGWAAACPRRPREGRRASVCLRKVPVAVGEEEGGREEGGEATMCLGDNERGRKPVGVP
jgi:hypothetical protein